MLSFTTFVSFFFGLLFVVVAKWDVTRRWFIKVNLKRNPGFVGIIKIYLKRNSKFRWASACLTGKKLLQKGSVKY